MVYKERGEFQRDSREAAPTYLCEALRDVCQIQLDAASASSWRHFLVEFWLSFSQENPMFDRKDLVDLAMKPRQPT